MSKRLLNLGRLLLGALIAGGVVWVALRPTEPSYQGKTLSAWLEELEEEKVIHDPFADVVLDTPATRAIRGMSQDAVPVLVRMARTPDTALRRRLLELRQQYDWLPFAHYSFDDIQTRTAFGFVVLGPAAKPAVRDLVRMLDDSHAEVRLMAAFALGHIGSEAKSAVPALQQALDRSMRVPRGTKGDMDQQMLCCYALGQMGDAARAALPQLKPLTLHSNMLIRAAAQGVLIRITGEGINETIENLRDPSNTTNWIGAAQTIMSAGTNAAPAIPLLAQALQQTNVVIQQNAMRAVGRIHLQPEISIPALTRLLQTNGPIDLRCEAMEMIQQFGTNAHAYLPSSELLRLLNDPNVHVAQQVTNTLRAIDPEALQQKR